MKVITTLESNDNWFLASQTIGKLLMKMEMSSWWPCSREVEGSCILMWSLLFRVWSVIFQSRYWNLFSRNDQIVWGCGNWLWLMKLQADSYTPNERDIFSDQNTLGLPSTVPPSRVKVSGSWNSNQKMEILRDDSPSLWKDLISYSYLCLITEDISVVTRRCVSSLSLPRPWCWRHCLILDLWIFLF